MSDNFKVKPVLVVKTKTQYNYDTVSIRCRIDATVKITGNVTGQVYIFDGAGSTVNVNKLDVDELLNKKRGQACCGGESNTSLFELA